MTSAAESNEKRPRVVALRYVRDAAAPPRVVAKGRGEIGERILEFARANGVPVRSDADLVELLSTCDVGDAIPIDMFEAVARLLSALYRINRDLTLQQTSTT